MSDALCISMGVDRIAMSIPTDTRWYSYGTTVQQVFNLKAKLQVCIMQLLKSVIKSHFIYVIDRFSGTKNNTMVQAIKNSNWCS